MKSLLLKFSGPLQAWGTGSHFEKRHTDLHPSKSAVVGILAAALGYKRDEDEKIRELNQLHFAVRVDQPGHILRDYHTAHKYKPSGSPDRTYVTERYYLEDAVFVAAVGSEQDEWIETIEDALQHPYFQPFLGRRSAPPTDDFFLGCRNEDVISALKKEEWQAAAWYQKRSDVRMLEIYADAELVDSDHVSYRQDRVCSFSNRERKFSYRKEGLIHMPVRDGNVQRTEDHDAFAALGE